MAGVTTVLGASAAGAGLLSQIVGQNEATDAITDGAQQTIDLQRQIYNDQIRRQQPFLDGAYRMHNEYQALLGMGGGGAATVPAPGAQAVPRAYSYPGGYDRFPAASQQPGTFQYWNPEPRITARPSSPGGYPAPAAGSNPAYPTSSGSATPMSAAEAQNAAIQRFYDSPYYRLPFDEGMQAIQNGAAARGSLLSGQTQKDLFNYGHNQAGNNFMNYMNALSNGSGMGQGVAQNMGSAGQTYASQVGQQYGNIADARASRDQGMWGGLANGFSMLGGLF